MFNTIREIVMEAGELMLSMSDAVVHQKAGHANFVTDADTAVQSFLTHKLHAMLPQAVFFAEEQENNQIGEEYTFIIDPIDGTTNFFRHHQCSAISVALMLHKEPLYGVIYNPYNKELYYAQKGKGAFLNGTPIHVSETDFPRGLVNMGTSPYYPELSDKTFRAARRLQRSCADLRRSGSAALDLCSVAAGRTDMFYEYLLSPWDYAAGSLIITEAGGKCGAFDGAGFSYEYPIPFMAANVKCFEPFKQLLEQIR